MEYLEPSVPRTPTQSVLRIVSILMAVIGVLVLVGGVIVLVSNVTSAHDIWSVATFGVMIVVAAGLLILTAALGVAASNDAARVGPYRFLCYLVGLAVLVAIVWGWGLGTFILFNPIVLATTIVYVLICSRLADRVKDERDHGVTGEVYLLSRHQRALRALSEVILVKGVLTLVVVAVLGSALVVYGEGERAIITGVPVTVSAALFGVLAVGGVSACAGVLVGALGVYGANRPRRVWPFLALTALALAGDVAQAVGRVSSRGVLGLGFDLVLDLTLMAACVYLAVRIMRQPSPEELLAATAGTAVVAPVGGDEGAPRDAGPGDEGGAGPSDAARAERGARP